MEDICLAIAQEDARCFPSYLKTPLSVNRLCWLTCVKNLFEISCRKSRYRKKVFRTVDWNVRFHCVAMQYMMTQWRLFPLHQIGHDLKSSSKDVSHNNIEGVAGIICSLALVNVKFVGKSNLLKQGVGSECSHKITIENVQMREAAQKKIVTKTMTMTMTKTFYQRDEGTMLFRTTIWTFIVTL